MLRALAVMVTMETKDGMFEPDICFAAETM
jgi:hypothetical protein